MSDTKYLIRVRPLPTPPTSGGKPEAAGDPEWVIMLWGGVMTIFVVAAAITAVVIAYFSPGILVK